MKKMKKLSAAVALALSMGVAAQVAQAEMLLKHDGKGDALLFPVYNGHVENYFTISNNENKWIQGHLRFRGAAWSGELLDFDVILSPGDVFVFRLADVNGDGEWEIDQSLDPNNFAYTAKLAKCKNASSGEEQDQCMNFGKTLVPTTRDAVITNEIVNHHLNIGYVEFIGEAVLEGMTPAIMAQLLSNSPGDKQKYQTLQGNRRGVSSWSWSQAAKQFDGDMGLSDVPNALSGTAFISLPGVSQGIAYNAEAFVNFRTSMVNVPAYTATGRVEEAHRIDNYRMFDDPKAGTYKPIDTDLQKVVANRAVIVHDEDVSGSGTATPYKPYGDYVLRFEPYGNVSVTATEDRDDEARMSFQNTWGPTLADGDDYELMGIRPTYGDPQEDDFDADPKLNPADPYGYGISNSIAEVEEAIRRDGQTYTAYYFDGDTLSRTNLREVPATLVSQYFAFFPTKVFWSEMYDRYQAKTLSTYLDSAVRWLLSKPKPYKLEVWDNFEREACTVPPPVGGFVSPYQPGGASATSVCTTTTRADTSPVTTTTTCVPVVKSTQTPCFTFLGHELTFFDIHSIKATFPGVSGTGLDVNKDFKAGRVVIDPPSDANDPFKNNLKQGWPALMYTFELGTDWSIGHWRRMQR